VQLIADEIATKNKDDLLCCSLQISLYHCFADKLQFGIMKRRKKNYINFSQKKFFAGERAVFSSAGKK
jgi:hypothetical protein